MGFLVTMNSGVMFNRGTKEEKIRWQISQCKGTLAGASGSHVHTLSSKEVATEIPLVYHDQLFV
jgi:hypothetical protein